MRNVVKFLMLSFLINNAPLVYAKNTNNTAVEKNFHTIIAGKSYYKDTFIIFIPFEYKQSALYHAFTYEVIDSVINILFKNKDVTLSIDGFVHYDEGNDTIRKYLSLNRALFVRDYVLGRGVDSSRIISTLGFAVGKPKTLVVNKMGNPINSVVELKLNYLPTPEEIRLADTDEDGIPDIEDGCANDFGYKENKGCPDKDAIIIPFEVEQSWLSPCTYKALDSVVLVLRENPSLTVSIQGHSYKKEGVNYFCEYLAKERAEVVRKYLLSRNISANRIVAVKSFGSKRPFNTGKTPQEEYANSRAQLFLNK